MSDTCVAGIDTLHNTPTREPDYELAIPGRSFSGVKVNPTAGQQVLCDPLNGTTNANADTVVFFRQRVQHMIVQNNSGSTVYIDFDAPANLGALTIPSTGEFNGDVPCDELHIFTTVATPYNGTVAGGLVIRAWQ